MYHGLSWPQLSYVAEDEKGKIVGYVLAKVILFCFVFCFVLFFVCQSLFDVWNIYTQAIAVIVYFYLPVLVTWLSNPSASVGGIRGPSVRAGGWPSSLYLHAVLQWPSTWSIPEHLFVLGLENVNIFGSFDVSWYCIPFFSYSLCENYFPYI
jgi:hypothetical protein